MVVHFPAAARPLIQAFAPCFSSQLFDRFVLLLIGAILTPGRHCVSAILRISADLQNAHFTTYYRFLSRARWSCRPLAQALIRRVIAMVPEGQPIVLAVDDTVARHKGPKVFGKGCHRDPVQSSQSVTVFTWGHRWVVVAIVVTFPGLRRPWALPVMACLYHNRTWCEAHGRRFKSWSAMAHLMVAMLLRWFPDRRFILLGDGGFSTHELACFACRHRNRLTLICRFYDDAVLHALPPKQPNRRGRGRPAKYGRPLPKPKQSVQRSQNQLSEATVDWYGGDRRRVGLLSAAGGWRRNGRLLVPIRWVFVHDCTGTHRDEYFMSSDPAMRPAEIVSLYTQRWSLETTFQECRRHLGLESTRQRSEQAVLRTTPLLLGLFTLVSLIWQRVRDATSHVATKPLAMSSAWHKKTEPTFSDALADVRQELWQSLLNESHRYGRWPRINPMKLILPLIRTLSLAG